MDAEAYVHIVMDAYHGDVVTLPAQLTVVDDGASGGDGHAEGNAGGELITVRMEAADALPAPPEADGWHLRFVGTRRAVDARSSDGTLAELIWEEAAFTARVNVGDVIRELNIEPDVAASRVTHVLVVPERART